MKLKLLSPLLLSLLLVSCGDGKSYHAYIRKSVGVITDTVADIYRAHSLDSGEYTVICVHISKKNDSAKTVTLSVNDIKGNDATPITFATGISSWSDGGDMHHYPTSPSTSFTVEKNEHEVYPDCYVCFEKGAIDKNVSLKIKGQEITHDESKSTDIDL